MLGISSTQRALGGRGGESHSRLLPLGWGSLGAEVSGWMETALQAPPQAGTHRGSWPPPALLCPQQCRL